MAPFASTRSRFVSLSRSTQEAPQPARLVSKADAISARASVNTGLPPAGGALRKTRVELLVRVRDEEVGAAVAAVVGRSDAHARVRVVEAGARRALLEPEAEAERIGAAPPCHGTFR